MLEDYGAMRRKIDRPALLYRAVGGGAAGSALPPWQRHCLVGRASARNR